MQLGNMFVSNCNNVLHVSDALIGYFTASVSNINVHTHCISLYCHWYSPMLIIGSKQ